MSAEISTLIHLEAPRDLVEWVIKQGLADDLETAWTECTRGDWMVWWLTAAGVDLKKITLAKCACARLALTVPQDPQVLTSIEVAEAWARSDTDLPLSGVKCEAYTLAMKNAVRSNPDFLKKSAATVRSFFPKMS